MNDKDLDQRKKEAAAKAKEEALKRLAERKRQIEKNEQAMESSNDAEDINMKALKNIEAANQESVRVALAKQKAQAVAIEKGENSSVSDEEKTKAKAKAAAAAKAKAAALAKRKEQAVSEEKEDEQQPAPNQSLLDEYVKKIEEMLGKDVLEEAYINRLSKNVATIVVKREFYFKVAECLKYNELLYFDYLVELHGTDFITHMEVYAYLYSHFRNQSVVLKVKLDREQPMIPSLVPLWEGANWPECEAYDLLGIQFENHPNLKRILLGEEWVGYPLRKDYEPFDVEV